MAAKKKAADKAFSGVREIFVAQKPEPAVSGFLSFAVDRDDPEETVVGWSLVSAEEAVSFLFDPTRGPDMPVVSSIRVFEIRP